MEKPADFFLGVIDFLGILVPGAALIWLHVQIFPDIACVCGTDHTCTVAVFSVTAYVLGQFLLGLGVLLNSRAASLTWKPQQDKMDYLRKPRAWLDWKFKQGTDTYLNTVCQELQPPISKESLAGLFNVAFSFLRLEAPSAVAEVERQAAEYKLFRSLTLVFLLDLTFTLVVGPRSVTRVVIAIVLAVLSYLRFAYLLGWTYHLAFEFVYVQARSSAAKAKGQYWPE